MPARPSDRKASAMSTAQKVHNKNSQCTFTDMSRKPRETLMVLMVNESEIRRIADGKLMPPKWGFFNNRHAERYRMLLDIAGNFNLQLRRSPIEANRATQHTASGQ